MKLVLNRFLPLFFLSFLLVFPLYSSFALFNLVQNIEDSSIVRVVISPFNSSVMCVASKNSLYESRDGGKDFKKLAVFKDEEIRHIFFDPHLFDVFYVATTRHLYEVKEATKQIYICPDEETIYAAAKHKGRIYIGTDKGLYSADEIVLNWRNLKTFNAFAVYWIESDKENMYIAAEGGIYLFKNEDEIERLFVLRKEKEETEESDNLVAQVIKRDIFDKTRLWLGTNRGLFVSYDSGLNWKKLYISGLGSLSINCLTQTKLQENALYVGTVKGFFKVDVNKNTAQEIFEGVYSSYISWIEFSPQGRIYLATLKGLFKDDYFTPSLQRNLESIVKGEPSVGEIQQAVLRYNEVHPEKIQKWRSALKYRALFPTFNLDYDKTVDYDSGSDKYFIGPRDWGFSLSWDIGDFVWNTYQDDVDTRSRLNTQLRLDILDEINRVYFERLRLKREIADTLLSEEELFKKQLRLQELTAIMDGYSGGYFSERIKELNEKR